MPAPPSTKQKAANQASMNKSKSAGYTSSQFNSNKTSPSKSSSYKSTPNSGSSNGYTKSPGYTKSSPSSRPSISNSNSGYSNNISTPRASGSPLNNPVGISRLSSRAISPPSIQSTPTSGNASLQDRVMRHLNVGKPLMQPTPQTFKTDRLSSIGYNPFQADEMSGLPYNPQPPAVQYSPGQQQARLNGFSQAQFGNQRLAPSEIYSDPIKSGPALRSVVNSINLAGGEPQQKVDAMLRNMGYSDPNARAAMLGRLSVESDNFAPDVISGQRMGDQGTAYGLAQWRGDRQDMAKAYSDQMGLPRNDLAGQAAFVGNELANNYPKSYAQIQGAKTTADAMKGMNSYERPRGYVSGGNPAKVEGYGPSMARANSFLSTPQQTRPTMAASFVSPMAAPPTKQVATSPSLWQQYAPQGLQDVASSAGNKIAEVQQAVNTYGADRVVSYLKAEANRQAGGIAPSDLNAIRNAKGGGGFKFKRRNRFMHT